MKKTYKAKIESLDEAIKTQGTTGNWDYDSYMHGMLNGMIFARAVITDTDPKFQEPPEKWLNNKSLLHRIKCWWSINKPVKGK